MCNKDTLGSAEHVQRYQKDQRGVANEDLLIPANTHRASVAGLGPSPPPPPMKMSYKQKSAIPVGSSDQQGPTAQPKGRGCVVLQVRLPKCNCATSAIRRDAVPQMLLRIPTTPLKNIIATYNVRMLSVEAHLTNVMEAIENIK